MERYIDAQVHYSNKSFLLVPPHIHSWERTLEVTAGDDITIICEATGHPPPTIAWRKYETGANLASPHSDRIVITNITRYTKEAVFK